MAADQTTDPQGHVGTTGTAPKAAAGPSFGAPPETGNTPEEGLLGPARGPCGDSTSQIPCSGRCWQFCAPTGRQPAGGTTALLCHRIFVSRIDVALSQLWGPPQGGVPYPPGWAAALVFRFVAPVQARPAASHSRARGGEALPQPLSGREAWQEPPDAGPTAKLWLRDIFRLEDGEPGGGPLGRWASTRTFAPLQCANHPRGGGRSTRAHCHPRLQALPGG